MTASYFSRSLSNRLCVTPARYSSIRQRLSLGCPSAGFEQSGSLEWYPFLEKPVSKLKVQGPMRAHGHLSLQAVHPVQPKSRNVQQRSSGFQALVRIPFRPGSRRRFPASPRPSPPYATLVAIPVSSLVCRCGVLEACFVPGFRHMMPGTPTVRRISPSLCGACRGDRRATGSARPADRSSRRAPQPTPVT